MSAADNQERPADGERRAMVGYLPQYEVAASVILRLLRLGTFEFVRIADPEAGRVDDVVVASTGRIDGHSVKWAEFPELITFNELVRDRGTAPPWIAQLADGWDRLTRAHPDRQVFVHLVTCNIPSRNDRCPPNKTSGRSFAEFIAEVWTPFQAEGHLPTSEWGATWDLLQQISGLDADRFRQFVEFCRFDFGTQLASQRTVVTREDRVAMTELRELASKLNALVINPARKIEYTREDLLRELGWAERYEFRHRHTFPIREPYEPIEDTVEDLRNAVDRLRGGYISLLGSPGSGKSSLLSHTLERESGNVRLIKYYAYIPDATDPRSLRGEAVYFLHDVVLAIEHTGFSIGQSAGSYDRLLLLERFHKQLEMLGADYADNGKKTVILIDGLDHIPREQRPDRSLLNELPDPSQVPDGVFIILGSQTDALSDLPAAVRLTMQQAARRIEMQRLGRDASLRIVKRAELPFSISREQVERIVDLGAGHPLGLNLVLNHLKQLASADDIESALATSHDLKGDINAYYYGHWVTIESQASMVELMGYLARLRDRIDLPWIYTWYDRATVSEMRNRFKHLFRVGPHDQWRFFHNSFRQFLVKKTASALGASATDGEEAFHRKLAEVCTRSEGPHAWDDIYHLAEAGDSAAVVERGVPERVSQQIHDFRPLDSIQDDLRRIMLHAGKLGDVVATSRTLLLMAEVRQRAQYVEPWPIAELLCGMDRIDTAIDYIWNSEELRVGSKDALKAARVFYALGRQEEAVRLFKACEPWNLLQPAGTSDRGSPRDVSDTALEWAATVPLFRPVDDIVRIVSASERPSDWISEEVAPETHRRWRAMLLYHAALGAKDHDLNEEFRALGKALQEVDSCGTELNIWYQLHMIRAMPADDVAGISDAVDALTVSPGWQIVTSHARIVLAEIYLRNLGQTTSAQETLQSIDTPEIVPDRHLGEVSVHELLPFFRYHRLIQTLNMREIPSEVVPDPEKDDDWPKARLARALVLIAGVWSDGWAGRSRSPDEALVDTRRLIATLHPTLKEARRIRSWYMVSSVRKDLYDLFLKGCHLHGWHFVAAASQALEAAWSRPSDLVGWSSRLRRDIALMFHQLGCNTAWVREQLVAIEDFMTDGEDVSGRVEEYRAHAAAFVALGDNDKAGHLVRELMASSLGVGYRKDYQLEDWIGWFDVLLAHDVQAAEAAVPLFAAAVQTTEETTEGRATRDASLSLLRQCFRVSPRRTIRLLLWLENHHCVSHEGAIVTLCQEAIRRDRQSLGTAWVMTHELLLSLADSSHGELVHEMAERIASELPSGEATQKFEQMAHAIKCRALPSTRRINLTALEAAASDAQLSVHDFGASALPAMGMNGGPSQTPDASLTLTNGTTLSEGEAKIRAKTVDGLLSLMRDATDSYYRWERLVAVCLESAGLDSARRLAQNWPSGFSDSLSLSRLSLHLSQNGDCKLAWAIAERALACSRAYGWVKWGDGGTRLEACRALIAADEGRGHRVALSQLTRDLAVGEAYPAEIAPKLQSLVELCHPNPPLREVWQEVERHVMLLSSPLARLDEVEKLWRLATDNDTPETALCDILVYHHKELVPLLSQAAERALAQLIQLGHTRAKLSVNNELEGTDAEQTAAVELLHALAIWNRESARGFAKALKALARSTPNYLVRRNAEAVLAQLGEAGATDRDRTSLPGIYLLELPSVVERKPDLVEPGEALPAAVNDEDMVRPYDLQLRLVAEGTGLDPQQVYARACDVMRMLAARDELSTEFERAYRGILHDAGIEFPYRRPRAAIARQAMCHVISELCDAGRIAPEHLPVVDRLVWCHDPYLALMEPASRPGVIVPIEGVGEHGSNVDDWHQAVKDGVCNLPSVLNDDFVVVGEATELRNLAWSVPTEIRWQAIASATLRASNALFTKVHDVPASDYHDYVGEPETKEALTVQHSALGMDSAGSDWIALNPVLCRSMGWRPYSDGLFAWADEEGHLLVQTIWWLDGGLQFRPPQFGVEVGEGWLVVASKCALEAICSSVGSVERRIQIARSYTPEEERREKRAVHTDYVPVNV